MFVETVAARPTVFSRLSFLIGLIWLLSKTFSRVWPAVASTGHGREKVEELITYFENNRNRMDYPSYRARGLRVTSGTVESANYHVTGARLKLQGMRWSQEGTAQMALLRADLFNGVWQRRTRELLAA